MIKQLIVLLILLCSLQSHSQKLIYKSNGNILNSENQKISPDQVRELLKDNEKLLADYNAGRSKKTFGNVLLIGGSALVITDVLIGANADVHFPSALTFIGLSAVAIAIPTKIGFTKKIKNVVSEYNNQKTTGYNQKLNLITNSKGIGFRLTLN